MIYVLIMYCTGFCPSNLPPPSDMLFFTSYHDCEAERTRLTLSTEGKLKGSPIRTEFAQTCSRVFADPKQIDRLLITDQLKKLLADYEKHGDGYKPWKPVPGPCGEQKPSNILGDYDYSCLFKQNPPPPLCPTTGPVPPAARPCIYHGQELGK